jgi:hypothetical protein
MPGRVQLVAVLGAAAMLLVVLEMVRRRRLMERYALLWIFSAVVLLVVAGWRDGLKVISKLIGVIYPPNALFFVGFAFILLLLLHFSSAVSRLSDQAKVLAQRAALMEERLRRLEFEHIEQDDRQLTEMDPDELDGPGRPGQLTGIPGD